MSDEKKDPEWEDRRVATSIGDHVLLFGAVINKTIARCKVLEAKVKAMDAELDSASKWMEKLERRVRSLEGT